MGAMSTVVSKETSKEEYTHRFLQAAEIAIHSPQRAQVLLLSAKPLLEPFSGPIIDLARKCGCPRREFSRLCRPCCRKCR